MHNAVLIFLNLITFRLTCTIPFRNAPRGGSCTSIYCHTCDTFYLNGDVTIWKNEPWITRNFRQCSTCDSVGADTTVLRQLPRRTKNLCKASKNSFYNINLILAKLHPYCLWTSGHLKQNTILMKIVCSFFGFSFHFDSKSIKAHLR